MTAFVLRWVNFSSLGNRLWLHTVQTAEAIYVMSLLIKWRRRFPEIELFRIGTGYCMPISFLERRRRPACTIHIEAYSIDRIVGLVIEGWRRHLTP